MWRELNIEATRASLIAAGSIVTASPHFNHLATSRPIDEGEMDSGCRLY